MPLGPPLSLQIRDRLLTVLMVYLTVLLTLAAVTSLGSLPRSKLELVRRCVLRMLGPLRGPARQQVEGSHRHGPGSCRLLGAG